MNNLDYGIIGNCRTAALVSKHGSIEWFCLPNFDSASVFGALLDKKKGGHFKVLVDDSYTITQAYIPNTNILNTRFKSSEGEFELLDFMPRYKKELTYHNPPDIVRYFKYISGKPSFRVDYNPSLEYARNETYNIIEEDYIKSYTDAGEYDSMYVYTEFDRESILNGDPITMEESGFILISYNQKILHQTLNNQYLKLQKTKVYWLNWSDEVTRYSKYQDQILRSALALKLLTYDKSGAVLAAATTSLPETIGEERNWDYRFCWIRDSSMVISTLTKLGHLNTVKRFVNFILDIIPEKDEKIQIMYGIDRQKTLVEEELSHLAGYENSFPVRIGNAAYTQKQNDIYGVLMDVILQHFKVFETSLGIGENLWTITRSIVHTVERNWRKPDKGIWEIRTEEKHFTFSKVLCWVAIDRAVTVAKLIHKKKYVKDWQPIADEIKQDILDNAWDEETQSYTQFYGSQDQDAANLLMEAYGFIDGKDEKYILTVKAIEKELSQDGLMYRYKNKDDFGVPSSSFTICTFWFINALNAIGETKKAKKWFDQVLKYSNHLGLFSEDIDFKTKRLLGNFPQAYSHLALIDTAINLSKSKITEDEEILDAIQREN